MKVLKKNPKIKKIVRNMRDTKIFNENERRELIEDIGKNKIKSLLYLALSAFSVGAALYFKNRELFYPSSFSSLLFSSLGIREMLSVNYENYLENILQVSGSVKTGKSLDSSQYGIDDLIRSYPGSII